MNAVSERRFGVEIEHGFPKGAQAARAAVDAAGFGAYVESVGIDGSGVELRTVPLKGTTGFKALRGVMDALREAGGYVTRADGMHVHFEAKEFYKDIVRVQRLVHLWTKNQAAIDQLVDAGRRRNGCTPKWNKGDIDNINRRVKDNEYYIAAFPRGCLNLIPLDSAKHTIEIRQHEGNLDPDVALAWITLCQAIIDEASKDEAEVKEYKTCRGLMDYLSLPDDAKEFLLNKARAERAARGKSRMHTVSQMLTQLRRDGAERIANMNDDAMGPLVGVDADPVDAGDID